MTRQIFNVLDDYSLYALDKDNTIVALATWLVQAQASGVKNHPHYRTVTFGFVEAWNYLRAGKTNRSTLGVKYAPLKIKDYEPAKMN